MLYLQKNAIVDYNEPLLRNYVEKTWLCVGLYYNRIIHKTLYQNTSTYIWYT